MVDADSPAGALVPAGYASPTDLADIAEDLEEVSTGQWTLDCYGTITITLQK